MSRKMKVVGILAVLAALCLFAACGTSAPAPEGAKAPAPKAAAKAPAAPKVENPWAKAMAGDWVEYKMAMGMGQKWTVLEKTPDKIVYEIATVMNGKEVNKARQEVNLHAPPPSPDALPPDMPKAPDVKPVTGEGIITVAGQTLQCKTIETTVQGRTHKVWICQDVPLTGMVRTDMDGKPQMELTGFGRGK